MSFLSRPVYQWISGSIVSLFNNGTLGADYVMVKRSVRDLSLLVNQKIKVDWMYNLTDLNDDLVINRQ